MNRRERVLTAIHLAEPDRTPIDVSANAFVTQRLHRDILGLTSPAPVSEDQLIRDLRLPASVVTTAIVALEMEGRLVRQPGGMIARP